MWTRYEGGSLGVLMLFIGIRFGTIDPGDLDLWPSDPRINWVPLPSRNYFNEFSDPTSSLGIPNVLLFGEHWNSLDKKSLNKLLIVNS